MRYSEEDITQEQTLRMNLCLKDIDEILKKHKCKMETRVEIVGEKIYPAVVVRPLKLAHNNGEHKEN